MLSMDTNAEPPLDWMLSVMSHVEGQVVFGDTKAGQLLAADTILLAGLVLFAERLSEVVGAVTLDLAIAAGVVLSFSLLTVLIAIAPAQHLFDERRKVWSNPLWNRVLDQQAAPAVSHVSGVVHFKYIAERENGDEYVRMAQAVTPDELARDILLSTYGKAKWAMHKFKWLDIGVKLTILAIVVALAGGLTELIYQLG
jgi:hypothetical protein